MLTPRKRGMRPAVLSALFTAAFTLLGLPGPAFSAPPSDPALLDNRLDTLARRFGVTLILEGTYQSRKDMAAPPASSAASSSTPTGGEMAQELDTLCRENDLTWTRKGNLILLSRRFTTVMPMPGITLGEYALTLNDIVAAMAPFDSHLFFGLQIDSGLKSLIDSFTPEQLARMKFGRIHYSGPNPPPEMVAGPVRMSELTPEQQQEVWRLARYLYMGSAFNDARELQREIDSLFHDDAEFCWITLYDKQFFGCELALKTRYGTPIFVSLDARGTGFPRDRLGPDPGSLRLGVPVKIPEKTAVTPDQDTLGSAVTLLHPSAPAVFATAPALSEKPIFLSGSSGGADPDSLLHGLAGVYGLRVQVLPDKSETITRLPVRPGSEISRLHDLLWSALPQPIVRDIQPETTLNARKTDSAPAPTSPLAQRLQQMKSTALAEFVARVEPKVNAKPNHRLRFSELSETEKNIFANLQMAELLLSLQHLLEAPAPEYITDFASIALSGGPAERLQNISGESFSHLGGPSQPVRVPVKGMFSLALQSGQEGHRILSAIGFRTEPFGESKK